MVTHSSNLQMSTTKNLLENLDWNQFTLEQLKQIQSEVGKAIHQKQSSLHSTDRKSSEISNYKASVAKVFPSHLRNSLTDYQRCIFLISLGSKNFIQSNRLTACIQWINQNFQTCTVIIGDSLYRLTLEVRHQSAGETALQEALQAGEEFINQNQHYFESSAQKCQFQFKRTSELERIHNTHFTGYYQQLENLYQNHASFQAMVNRFSQAYLNRGKEIKIDPGKEDKRQETSLANTYCLEESALLACLVEEQDSPFIYPGSIKIFEEISEGLHPEVPDSLQRMIWVSLRLKKK
ncbi:tRNA-dependent cyclodipeptide synthase [Roseofilum capinflatum]|uniref:Cyclodipeptide synthase n=1 Tax=Roseofilum capinflatum BLCC-M114 TaxID=3022440 RepID=A0ABT7B136_9CYAN|nr:tRNA-dependent cyclodipeptide synthase [Roseofilum capinflatum]MDJ1172537.1 tRNA-dependent cyclodipeptide synthase [Roseofilum capinflatum BLCC-M114]